MDLRKTLFPTENPHLSSKWISGRELIERRGIIDFELFDFMKQGLQAYTKHGKKIVDSDPLEKAPSYPLDFFVESIRHAANMKVLGGRTRPPLSEAEIISQAKAAFNSQPLKIVNRPKNCEPISFTLPEDEKKAEEVILKAMSFLFKMEEVLSFEREHGLIPQELQVDPTLSATPSSQDERGLDVQKYIDKSLADGVPKEKIVVELKERFNLSYFHIGQKLVPEGLNSEQHDAFKTRGYRLYQKGLELITEGKRGKKDKKR